MFQMHLSWSLKAETAVQQFVVGIDPTKTVDKSDQIPNRVRTDQSHHYQWKYCIWEYSGAGLVWWQRVTLIITWLCIARTNQALDHTSINQINQTSIAPISPVKPCSVARQPNQCSTAKSRKQFRSINRPWGVMVSMGERPSQRDVSSDTSSSILICQILMLPAVL